MFKRLSLLGGTVALTLLTAGCGAPMLSTLPDRPLAGSTFLRAREAGPVIGAQAPALTVQGTAGGSETLADLHGKGVIVTFFASWCPHCQHELTAFDAIMRKICSCRGLVVLPVNAVDEPAQTLEAFREKLGLTFPVYLDPGSTMTGRWGIQDVPTMFFVNRQGTIVAKREGEVQTDDLNQLINTILKYGP